MIVSASLQALERNKLRSALTMLGVFIGVAALIAMVAVGDGASAAVKKQLESLGTNMVVVQPGATTAGGVRAGAGSASTLTVTDAQTILRDDPAVPQVGYLTRQAAQVQYGDQNWSTAIQGVSPSYLDIVSWQIASGSSMTEQQNDAADTVCLIGQTVYQNLFPPGEDPVGAIMLIKGVPMRVIGLLARKGQTGFGQDQDDVVLIPFNTAERKVLGVAAPQTAQNLVSATYPPAPNAFGISPRMTGYVNSIYVQAGGPDLVTTAISQVTATLARRHHIQTGQLNDFSVRNLSQIAQAQESSSQVMSALLATVASISLLVGGIGIMNILLVSVTERTREIGIRMAIGARRLQVLLQFLVESVLLSVTGGAAGIAVGVVVSFVISGSPTGRPRFRSPPSSAVSCSRRRSESSSATIQPARPPTSIRSTRFTTSRHHLRRSAIAQRSACTENEPIPCYRLPFKRACLFRDARSSWPGLPGPSVALFLASLLRRQQSVRRVQRAIDDPRSSIRATGSAPIRCFIRRKTKTRGSTPRSISWSS